MNNRVPFRLPQPVNQYVAHKESCALLKVFGMFPPPSGALTSPKVGQISRVSRGRNFQLCHFPGKHKLLFALLPKMNK